MSENGANIYIVGCSNLYLSLSAVVGCGSSVLVAATRGSCGSSELFSAVFQLKSAYMGYCEAPMLLCGVDCRVSRFSSVWSMKEPSKISLGAS